MERRLKGHIQSVISKQCRMLEFVLPFVLDKMTCSAYCWCWRQGVSPPPSQLPSSRTARFMVYMVGEKPGFCYLQSYFGKCPFNLCHTLPTLGIWPNLWWSFKKTVQSTQWMLWLSCPTLGHAPQEAANLSTMGVHGQAVSDWAWRNGRNASLLWLPFLKLFIQEKIVILLEKLSCIDLYGFRAAQKRACSRVLVAGTVVRSFIFLWYFKDFKYGLVVWNINFTSEPVLETRAIYIFFSVYESHCVTLGLPVPAEVEVSDASSLHGAPESHRLPHGHSHYLILRHQHMNWHGSWKKRHERGSVRTGAEIIDKGHCPWVPGSGSLGALLLLSLAWLRF